MFLPSILPDLLPTSVEQNAGAIHFLANDGQASSTLPYHELLPLCARYAQGIIAAGVAAGGRRVVVTSFDSHREHIIIFWACCLAGIPLCPLPALHPDPNHRAALIQHVKTLFDEPMIVASSASITSVFSLIPGLATLAFEDIRLDIDAHSEHVFPSYRPSPEMPVCYMLTSGSTGMPKAVVLQHIQILSSCNGKSIHHQTDKDSRFLNWIAFDHVAAVTEIHIHSLLVAASQWHVAPIAIVRNPRALLEWSARLGITYTFSPNFLLCRMLEDLRPEPLANDVDLSALRCLISGGEAVPLSTARAVAQLLCVHKAPANVLRAGFGMSETAAGSIYDVRPISALEAREPSSYLPLGKCAPGIFMRVVDADGVTLPAGEVGELQLSGPTIFTGYHKNAEATAAAFTFDGWFSTGDLATIDEQDNLELVGRLKDCLNINGVKTAVATVEDFVNKARISGVEPASVVVVPIRLPGAATETYAVFYSQRVIPGSGDMTTEVVKATRDDIKHACIRVALQAPHIVLPLPEMYFAKSALGKVSRGKLGRAYLNGELAEIEAQYTPAPSTSVNSETDLTTPLAHIVARVVSDVFQVEPAALARATNLFDMGASSMHILRFKQMLQERTGLSTLSAMDVLERPKLGDLVDHLAALQAAAAADASTEQAYRPLVCLHAQGSKPPVFLVHPGVGEIVVFINLARRLADDRPVYALRARGFEEGESTFGSMQEAVDAYHDAIVAQHPDGPYLIAGYSYGGALAFEIGKKLEAAGRNVQWVGIFNLPPHIQERMNQLSWTEVLVNLAMFLSLVADPDDLRAKLRAAFPAIAAADARPVELDAVVRWLFGAVEADRLRELDLQPAPFARWVDVAYDITRSGRDFVPQGQIRGALVSVFCAVPLASMGTREEYKARRLAGWREFVAPGGFEMVDVDGAHYTMIGTEYVESFADRMRCALGRSEEHAAALESRRLRAPGEFDAIPVVDFALSKADPAAYQQQLSAAFQHVGYGILVNVPGFEEEFQSRIFKLASAFFSKPKEWKSTLAVGKSHSSRGYLEADDMEGPYKAHAEALRFGEEKRVPVGLDGVEAPFWLRSYEGPNQWPSDVAIPGFRAQLELLFDRYQALNVTLNAHLCGLLGVAPEDLDGYRPDTVEFSSTVWHYAPLPADVRAAAPVPHGDGLKTRANPTTLVTCMIQSHAGLQVQNDLGEWVDVPMVKGGVIINIGDRLSKVTEGRLTARTHHVDALIEEDRFAIPYVLSTRVEKPRRPLRKLAGVDVEKLLNSKFVKTMIVPDALM